MDPVVATVAERPDLAVLLDDFPDTWPEFLHHQRLSTLFYERVATRYAEFCLVAVDSSDPGRPIAKAYSMPVDWDGDSLPPDGHDAAIMQAAGDQLGARPGRIVAAVEVTVQTAWQGRGLSRLMLAALRANAARLGFGTLIVPVRPTHKHRYPEMPLDAYVAATRPDGLPEDPWLRVHVRAGGEIVGIAPCSMTISAPLAHWRRWTGLPFRTTGPVLVPDALVPVHCDTVHDIGVYIEPNVWIRHTFRPRPGPGASSP